MKFNFKVCVINGFKGTLLLLLLAFAYRFVSRAIGFNTIDEYIIQLIILIVAVVIFILIIAKAIPNMKGYSDDPDWDIEFRISIVIALFSTFAILFSLFG